MKTSTKTSMKTFNDVKALDTAISQVILGAQNLKALVHEVSVGIVAHAAGKGNGNVTRAKTLVDGLGAGFKQDSLIAWFAGVGINFNEEGEVSLDRKLMTPENFTVLKSKPWYEFKKVNPYQGFDLNAKLNALLKGAYKAETMEGEEASLVKIDPELLRKLEALVPVSERPKKPVSNKPLTAVGKTSLGPKAPQKEVKAA